MDITDFFTASGVFAWVLVAWRTLQVLRGLPRRIRWALFGPRRTRSPVRFMG
ncbi:MAG: hypothetical protein J0I57_04190 [Hyphomicrobium sp.]|jgi:hypothetical protein|nr:hypothetical protein [Hyphomicrobium sp.]